MKHLYIVYGCNKLYSRLNDSFCTWLSDLRFDEDYIILGEVEIPELKMIGFPNDNGEYLNLGMRTLIFLDKYDEYLRQWDWITFVDDDAYVFKHRLRKKLCSINKNEPTVIGNSPGNRQMNMVSKKVNFTLMHGGATININNIATINMLNYLKKNKELLFDRSKVDRSFMSFGDVCVSYLIKKTMTKILICPKEFSFIHHKFHNFNFIEHYKFITSHRVSGIDKKKLFELESGERNLSCNM